MTQQFHSWVGLYSREVKICIFTKVGIKMFIERLIIIVDANDQVVTEQVQCAMSVQYNTIWQ